MIGIGPSGMGILAVLALLPLTLGLGAVILAPREQVKVHALGLAATGPMLLLLCVPFWGDARTVLTGLLLVVFLLVTATVSGHAIMWLLHGQRGSEPGEEAEPDGAPGRRSGDAPTDGDLR